ncbi:hypothetical protein AJ85_09225 [Alkalihalobacillus alcalophilus ATCC 27647 = CGMCC 1.3604]|uniref:Uncharacterized protein n=1 Tax=Alkalihalobacillus alcalophilus ATCC 27647 = CGMCC 1.3604 TaxID=1218173 RepID=A0A094WNT1_ALKAL|nr:hypothetical protein BALCAV_0209260 [Alkalihalobacillus alcalophilus ATCC 27647 = CGMCC 1.3604]THG90690.1 hypothetical protein AJ85_09225 [Alkalihalobacillus alcalophilus ATCC 27647 = CGMCC 1.3604]
MNGLKAFLVGGFFELMLRLYGKRTALRGQFPLLRRNVSLNNHNLWILVIECYCELIMFRIYLFVR